MTGRILVTGATGTVGAELVRRLASVGHATRALIRDTAKRNSMPDDGVEIALGSFDDSASLAQAMTGIDVLVLITPAAANAHEMATEAIAAAEAAGVKKIVRLSALQADENGPTDNTRQHARTEKRLHQSGLRTVILRPQLYMQNLFMMAQSIAENVSFSFGMGDASMGMIDTRDVARCAAVCATTADHDGKTIELSGPESISYHDVAAILSRQLGRKIGYVPASPEAVYQSLAGWDAWMAALARDYAIAYRSGWGDYVNDGVREITGEPATPFASFAREVFVPALRSLS